MWIPTYHVFPSRAAFVEACDAAGWPRALDSKPVPPEGATLMEIGPLIAAPSLETDGSPTPGDVLDPRYHVNAAWHGMKPPTAFQAALVSPATPYRSFGLPGRHPPAEPPVPTTIAAWKGKAALREAGLLEAVEAAVAAAGGRVEEAWVGASEWSRDSDFLAALASGIGITPIKIDEMFRVADAIQS